MKKLIRDILNWLMEFLPMYHMKFRFSNFRNGEVFDACADTDEWFLPAMKKKIKRWNEEAMNPKCDPNNENYAFYVRIR
jgi:hypothetical protein